MVTIREARKNARYSQEAAAGKLGMSRPTYAKLENNPDLIDMRTARNIASLFEVSIDELNFFENEL